MINPQFIKAIKQKLQKQETFMMMEKKKSMIKNILDERKMGIVVTQIPDEFKDEIERLMWSLKE